MVDCEVYNSVPVLGPNKNLHVLHNRFVHHYRSTVFLKRLKTCILYRGNGLRLTEWIFFKILFDLFVRVIQPYSMISCVYCTTFLSRSQGYVSKTYDHERY